MEGEEDFFEISPDFPMPEIGPEWDEEVNATTQMVLVAHVDVDPPLNGNPACLCGDLSFGGRIVFTHYRDFEGETFTRLMLEEHVESMLAAFQRSLYTPNWWN